MTDKFKLAESLCKSYEPTVESRELALSTINNGALYRDHAMPIIKRMAQLVARGTYDADKAVKAFVHLATDGAKVYCRECCGAGVKYYDIFSPSDREKAAAEMLEHYSEYIAEIAIDAQKGV